MKKFLLATILSFLFLGSALAQPQGGSSGSAVANVTVAPTTCTAGVSKPVVYLGTMYQCSAGTYYAVPTTAAGGSITGLTATRVPVAASATTLTDDANFTYSGSNLQLVLTGQAFTVGTANASTYIGIANTRAYIGYDGAQMLLQPGSAKPFLIRGGHATFGSGNVGIFVGTDSKVGVGETSPGAQLQITNIVSSTTIGQIIKLAPSQSADALEVQNSSSTVLTSVTKDGYLNVLVDGAAANPAIAIRNSSTGFYAGTGAVYSGILPVYSGSISGVAFVGGGTNLGDGYNFRWTINGNPLAAVDVGIGRNATANRLEINTGVSGTYADLIARSATFSRAGEQLLVLNNTSSSVPNVTIGIGSGSQHSDGYFFFDAASTPTVASQMFVFTYGATSSGFAIGKAGDTGTVLQAWSTAIPLSIIDNIAAATAANGLAIGSMQQGASTITSGTRRSVYFSSAGFAPTSGTGVFNQLELATTINQTGGASGITRGIYINPTLTAAADWRGLDIMASYVNTSGTLVNVNVRSDFNAASSSSATPAGIQSDVRTQGSQNYTSSTGLLGIQSLFTGYGSGTVTWVRGFRAYLDAYQATVTSAAGLYVSSIAASGTGSVGTKYGIYLENQTGGTTANYSIYSAGGASLLNAGTSTVVPLTLKGAASQSAALFQTKDSTDAVNFVVTKDGYVAVGGTAPSANAVFTTGAVGGAIGFVNYNSYYGISGFNVYQQYGGWTTFAGINSTELAIGGGVAAQWTGTRFYNSTAFTAGFLNQVFYLASDVTQKWSSTTAANGTADLSLSRISAGVLGVGTGAAGSTAGSLSMTNLTLAGNFFAGPSTIESFTSNGSALGTLNYYTDSQTIYYDTAAATGNVTVAVKAAAGTNLNTRLAVGQAVTLVLKITNTGTAYNIAGLTIDTVSQTLKWLNGSAPSGNINATDTYTFYIYKTADATFYVEATQQSYK